jgi:hypothetical protein
VLDNDVTNESGTNTGLDHVAGTTTVSGNDDGMATEIVSIQALADDTGITTYDDGIVTYVGMKLGTAHVLSSGVNVGRAV